MLTAVAALPRADMVLAFLGALFVSCLCGVQFLSLLLVICGVFLLVACVYCSELVIVVAVLSLLFVGVVATLTTVGHLSSTRPKEEGGSDAEAPRFPESRGSGERS